MTIDRCKLTGSLGKFVKSHILPSAVTQSEFAGAPLFQGGEGEPTVRRWTSWYDRKLVTSEGEEILSQIDSWGIHELRRHKLIWSGWGPMQSLGELQVRIPDSNWGYRHLFGVDAKKLRLFLVSLLWRAAATSLREFTAIQIPPSDLETLRMMVVRGDAHPYSFYACQLIQLSSIGTIHNHSPLAQIKTIPATTSQPEAEVHIFRFYFDGLIVHFHRSDQPPGYAERMGSLVVGGNDELVVTTVPYEDSTQRVMLDEIMRSTYTR